MVKKTFSDKVLDIVIYAIIFIISVVALIPIWNTFVVSVTPLSASAHGFSFWPREWYFGAWKSILTSNYMWHCMGNSVVRTVLGTIISIVLTITTAYPLSKERLPFRKIFMPLVTFTMIFSGGLIPNFLLVKNLGMIDSIWALLLPTAITAFNVIVMKNFFQSIPKSLEEAAAIDGANDIVILWKVVLPLSLPSIATIGLWIAVANWNAWFDVVLYVNDRSKYVLPMVLREFLTATDISTKDLGDTGTVAPPTEAIKSASTLFVVIPILCVYPFLQKYFMKGVTVGAVKE